MADFEIKNLSFSYSDSKKNALEDINLKISQGEFVLVCGKSGCGKTTLLRHLKPSLTPFGKKTGEIFFEGKKIEDIKSYEEVQKIGFVMQDIESQIVTDKVWHELAFGLESLSMKKEKIRMKCAEMASYFGIDSWFYKDINQLSGGQKQILNLAGVMILSPDVLILDEPTSQLDPVSARDFIDTVKKINEEFATTVIITEHRLEEIIPISDRVIVMQDSKIIIDDSPREAVKKLYLEKNEMFMSMPSASKISASMSNQIALSIKEGRNQLAKKFKKIQTKEIEKEIENKFSIKDIFKTKKIPKDGIYLEEIYFRYDKDSKDVVKNLNLHIPLNTIFSINGANGSGKSTAISIIAGILKPYRGNIYINSKKIDPRKELKAAILPQNPKYIFLKDTVRKDFEDMFTILTKKEIEKIEKVIKLMEIEEIMESNPYDLSGGELQKAAIAKLLLKDAQILLLDEPTKAMDSFFKEKFYNILNNLKKNKKTIIMVSHDIEFCAQYSDISAMFFDGNITSMDKSKKFFAGNNFYTTSANKIARDYFKNTVTVEDVIGEIENAKQNG